MLSVALAFLANSKRPGLNDPMRLERLRSPTSPDRRYLICLMRPSLMKNQRSNTTAKIGRTTAPIRKKIVQARVLESFTNVEYWRRQITMSPRNHDGEKRDEKTKSTKLDLPRNRISIAPFAISRVEKTAQKPI